jgi:hypothetical protein
METHSMSELLSSPCCGPLDAATEAFYRDVLQTLNAAGVPYLVGGAFAFACYTGIERNTKDLDLFIHRRDYERVGQALKAGGYEAEMTYSHWLAKIHRGDTYVDLIFSSGNAVAEVDDEWFEHAHHAEVLGLPVLISPPEEMIWSKGFIMERERYDGADVAHLIHAWHARMDWHRLLRRFGPHWRVLFTHLVLFGFIYPAERDRVPAWVMGECLQRLRQDLLSHPPADDRLCGGTLLSREQYLADVEQRGYQDLRERPLGAMTPEQIQVWTAAIPGREAEVRPSA